MPSTKATILRQAATLLGKSSVYQSADGGPAGKTLDDAYERLLPAVLETSNWRFATVTKQLQRLEHTSNVDGFRYVYKLPSGYLTLNKLIPHGDYDIQENYLYSNSESLKAEIRYRVDPSRFTASFVNYFVHKLALDAGPALQVKKDLLERIAADEERAYIAAIASSAQSVPNQSIVDKPLVRAGVW